MPGHRPTVLFVDGYRSSTSRPGVASSDSIGYGITAADAICRELGAQGYRVLRPLLGPDGHASEERPDWTASSYRGVLGALRAHRVDLVMCFHAFGPFPAEIRRMCLDLGQVVPLVGYTMGSHWDPTDEFRTAHYPGMHVVDLANLHVLDRILMVSHHLRDVLRERISAFSAELGAELAARMVVVGLPIDTALIDACRPAGEEDGLRTTVVFNHAPIAPKQPELFLRVVADLLHEHDVQVLLTRRFPACSELHALTTGFPGRILEGDDLPIEQYYRSLWTTDIQVSTARHESLGISTLEAMYTGNYCIVPRIGSYPEILGNDHPGLYDGSAHQLLEHLRWAVTEPRARRAVAERLRSRATRYAPDRVTRGVAAVLEDLLGG